MPIGIRPAVSLQYIRDS